MTDGRRNLLRALGPGVLFTGAAVGVSHLVQSTRAGAAYGLALVGVVLLANAVKYPAFRFGPLYAAATRTSLLEGYRRQGRWALVLYGLLTLGTMFTVQAAVTAVTAGLAAVLFGLTASPLLISVVLLAVCATLVATGGYRWLDGVSKIVVTVLAVCTLAATAVALPRVDFGGPWMLDFGLLTAVDVAFLAALVGWMPSAIDVAVWQSLWTLARRDQTGHAPSAEESSFDFHAGYVGTAVLAVCFLVLGAVVLHRDGVEVAASPAAFAAQLIDLYAQTLGEWSRWLIGGAAFATMFSTTLAVVDGFPRALSVLVERLRTAEVPGAPQRDRTPAYWGALAVLCVGAVSVLAFLAGSMKTLIDLATTLSFLSAPVLSWLNHRAVTSDEVPDAMRPRPWLIGASWVGIVFQAAFAVAFVVLLTSS